MGLCGIKRRVPTFNFSNITAAAIAAAVTPPITLRSVDTSAASPDVGRRGYSGINTSAGAASATTVAADAALTGFW